MEANSNSKTPERPERFSRNTLIYGLGLSFLFTGLVIEYGVGVGLLVIGAILTGVSVATSFFVTWLSAQESA